MPQYNIGKVFSDSVADRFASRADRAQSQGGGSIIRQPRARGGGGDGGVAAAQIRAATADKDRDARVQGQMATLGQRQQEAELRAQGASARDRAKSLADQAEFAMAQVKDHRDGLKLIAWMESKAREKDAYGRTDPDLIRVMAPLIQEANRRLTAPPDQGGLGLPPQEIGAASNRAIASLGEGIGAGAGAPESASSFEASLGSYAAPAAAPAKVGGKPKPADDPLQFKAPAADTDTPFDTSWLDAFEKGEKPAQTR